MTGAVSSPLDEVRHLLATAQAYVRGYAKARTPTVDPALVDAIVAAIGTISLAEAEAALAHEAAAPDGLWPDLVAAELEKQERR